jgi:hypothetical protein
MLDADALTAPWELKLGGRVHTARPVSTTQVRAWSEAHKAAERLPDPRFEARVKDAALHRLLRRAFPWRWQYLLDREADPLWHFWRRPKEVQEEIVESFFVYRGIFDRQRTPGPKPTASSSRGAAPGTAPPASPGGS